MHLIILRFYEVIILNTCKLFFSSLTGTLFNVLIAYDSESSPIFNKKAKIIQ